MTAIRATVRGGVQGVGFRAATRERALELGLRGWVRNGEDGTVLVHAEVPRGGAAAGAGTDAGGAAGGGAAGGDAAGGAAEAIEALVAFLREGPPGAAVDGVEVERVRREGHEQFAIRGVAAGIFVVQEHQATSHHWDLRLEVDGVMRSWAVPKGPSLDPAVKRMAIEVEDHGMAHNDFEGPLGDGGVIVWDRGPYEQGGRVPWPEAIERGHAVFVLHGEKLRGGFALQRTGRSTGPRAQWLLIKRRDEQARAGSDVTAERPESVVSGKTLDEIG